MTTIEIAEDQAAALEEISAREHRPVSEIVRDLLAASLAASTPPARQADSGPDIMDDPAFRDAFGLWEGLVEDGVEYQRRLRAEWDHRP